MPKKRNPTREDLALPERLRRLRGKDSLLSLRTEMKRISKHCTTLSILDERSPDEILGYDEYGLPR